MRYHVDGDLENQIVGGDLVALTVGAPVCVLAGVAVWQGRPVGPVVALAPTAFAMYLYTQLAISGEFATAPGNSGRAFPLLLALFWLAGAGFVMAWRSIEPAALPEPGDTPRRTLGAVFTLLAIFIAFGLHVPGLVDVVGGPPYGVDYTQGPAVFWVVKWMDLGLVVPLAVITAVGVLRRAPWASLPVYAALGSGTLLGSAVAAMGVVMVLRNDPAANNVVTGGFVVFALGFWVLTGWLFGPLLREPTRVR